jgi:hypothetical protein
MSKLPPPMAKAKSPAARFPRTGAALTVAVRARAARCDGKDEHHDDTDMLGGNCGKIVADMME